MRVLFEMMGCQDCLLYVANGDGDTDLEAKIQSNAGVASGMICCGDSDKDEEFSWSACECCGSRLGGSRHHLVALGE